MYGHFLFYLCSCFQLFLTCELIHFSVRASMLSWVPMPQRYAAEEQVKNHTWYSTPRPRIRINFWEKQISLELFCYLLQQANSKNHHLLLQQANSKNHHLEIRHE
jgi:hypothetical protein